MTPPTPPTAAYTARSSDVSAAPRRRIARSADSSSASNSSGCVPSGPVRAKPGTSRGASRPVGSTAANGPTTVPASNSTPMPVRAWSPITLPTFTRPVSIRSPFSVTATGR